MKKNLVLVIAFLTIFLGLYAISHTSYAEDTGRPYTLLAPLPLEEGGGLTRQVTFTTYVNGAFRFILGVAGILAVIMIIYAGFTYMTTDAFQKKEEGREIISNAVKGLLLAIGTWIIINTINPKLLEFDLIITKPTTPTAVNRPVAGTGSPTNGAAGPNNQFCTNCTDLSGLNLKPGIGTQLDAEMVNKLQNFNSELGNINWRITEAFPPESTSHSAQCHYNGTCIDANFTNGTPATAENINTFITAAANNNMIAEYEVATQTEATRLRNEGVTGTIRVVPYITAPHFSVYNAQAPVTN